MKKIITLLCLTILFSPAYAEVKPSGDTALDGRIKRVQYNANDVIRVDGFYGYTTVIYFGSDEVIEFMSTGFSDHWDITMIKDRKKITVRPLQFDIDSNLTVITDKRSYNFALYAKVFDGVNKDDVIFALHFDYPEDKTQKKLKKVSKSPSETLSGQRDGTFGQRIVLFGSNNGQGSAKPIAQSSTIPIEVKGNYDYTYAGSVRNKPVAVHDDGRSTYFQFDSRRPAPAVFVVTEDGTERLINPTPKSHYVVIPSVYDQFVLRFGAAVTCVFNDNRQHLAHLTDNKHKRTVSNSDITGHVDLIKKPYTPQENDR